jgi:hypothetical protein
MGGTKMRHDIDIDIDNIREAVKAIEDALHLIGMHVRAEVDAEVIEEAFMALDYICKVLSLSSIASLRCDKQSY